MSSIAVKPVTKPVLFRTAVPREKKYKKKYGVRNRRAVRREKRDAGRPGIINLRKNIKMNDKQADKSALEKFRDKARIFQVKLKNLQSMKNDVKKYPALQAEYNELVGKGSSIRSTIRTITGGVDNVVSWWNSIFGSDTKLNSMGFLPLIPIAIVAGSVAAMGKWARDAYMFNRRFEEIKRLEKKGISPGKAAEIVAGKEPRGIVAGVAREVMIPVTLAGVALTVGWYLFNNAKK